jgi:hypothetical protein
MYACTVEEGETLSSEGSGVTASIQSVVKSKWTSNTTGRCKETQRNSAGIVTHWGALRSTRQVSGIVDAK